MFTASEISFGSLAEKDVFISGLCPVAVVKSAVNVVARTGALLDFFFALLGRELLGDLVDLFDVKVGNLEDDFSLLLDDFFFSFFRRLPRGRRRECLS